MTPPLPSRPKRHWFINLPIRRQVVAFFLLYLVLVVGLVFMIGRSAAAPQAEIAALSHASRVSDLADAMTISLADGMNSFIRYLTTGSSIYRDQLAAHQAEYRSLLREIEAEVASSPSGPSADHWPQLEALSAVLRQETVEPGLALRQAVADGVATPDDLAQFIADESHLRRMMEIRAAIDMLAADERALSAQYGASIAGLAQNLQWIYLSGALLLLGFGLLVAIHIDVDIAAPIQRMTKMAREIADGNLDRRIGWTRTDEIGQMASNFDDMVGRLQSMIRAQEASLRDVQQKEAVQAAMLDGSVEGLALISPDYRIMTVNHRLAELLGVEVREVLDQDVMSLIPLAHRTLVEPEQVIREVVAMFQAGDDAATIQIHQHYPVARELQGYSTAVRSSTGENLGRLVAVRDVTSERQSDRMKSEFVSMVSHELRTPLTSVKGYVDLLRDGELGDLTDDQLGFLNIVANSTDRLVDLINDLLDISRIESGKLSLNLEPLDVATRIHEVIATLRPRLDEKRHQLSLSLPGEPLLIVGDANRIDQILTNLLTNAIKYTPDGGTIAVSAELDETTLRINVTDSGIGIAEADQDQLFTRFYRSENPAVRQVSGTGLGLAITRSLAELHGGEITIQSELGAGSTFTVVLPRAAAAVRPDWTTGLGRPRRQILALLDAPDVADQLSEVFQSYGHTMHIAMTAAEGLRLALEVKPTLILVADHLPDADSLSLVRRLRTEPTLNDPAIILLSYARVRDAAPGFGPDASAASPTAPEVDERVFRLLALDGAATVLVGGDNLRARRLIADLLRRSGHQVLETAGGVAAIEATLSNTVDLALINSKMSDADQFELLRSLRTNARTQAVPLIAMITQADSASATQVLVETLSALVLNKHLTPDELVAMIDPALSAASPE